MPKTAANRKKVLEDIKELYYIRHMSMQKVADVINMSLSQVQRYCKELDKEIASTIKDRDVQAIIRHNMVEHDKMVERMWRNYDDETNPRLKSRIIRDIDRSNAEFVITLQNLKVIPKPAEKVTFEPVEIKLKWARDRKDDKH